jgi:adenylate cyclase
LSQAIHSMKKGLQSFQRYVPAVLVRQLIETGNDVSIGGSKKKLAILFSDITNFTSIVEKEKPTQVMVQVCEYLNELSNIILQERGTIDKYIGDSIMAFWGAPLDEADPCRLAARAAVRCIKRLEVLNTKWRNEGKVQYPTRIGIHWGEAIVGNMGSSERLNYTAIGDAINFANRLEGINKVYGTNIIVSEAFFKKIQHDFVLRKVDYIVVKGRTSAGFIYELLAENKQDLSFDIDLYRSAFDKGFAAYQNQEWDEAIRCFSECLNIYPQDKVAPIFIDRCKIFKDSLPMQGWQGIWYFEGK